MQSVNKPVIFIATLGSQPQVVTLGLDALLPISEVIIRYLSPQNTQKDYIHNALRKLDAAFKNGRYGKLPLRYRPYPIRASSTFLHTIQDEVNANAAWLAGLSAR